MAMEHQFIVPGSASLLKGRQGVIYEELGGLERQYRWKLGAMVELGTGAGGSIATDTLFDAAGDLVQLEVTRVGRDLLGEGLDGGGIAG